MTAPSNLVRPRLSAGVIALGVVSLLTDVSSEMIYPLLPVFLSGTLGASAALLGLIEGAAETTAALLKLWSGYWSDRLPRRKPLVVAGYVISAVARPLVALATAGWHVLVVRVSDRVGKGIRSSPRDALIADATDVSIRGRAYGFHRAMDNLGAVIGPLVAFVLLSVVGLGLRSVFWLAAIPAVLSVGVLVLLVREAPRIVPPTPPRSILGHFAPLPAAFKRYLAVLLLFTLGAASDAFLLLRASELGVSAAQIPLLWAAMHVVRAAMSTAGGALSDAVGRRPVIIAGWGVSALTYAGFAVASAPWHAWALFLTYGLFFALTEGSEKALVADLVTADLRGAAFGWFNLTLALGALPASVLFGLVWMRWSSATAFGMGAVIAMLAAVLLLASLPRRVLPIGETTPAQQA
jgi:MFS family permease